MSGYDDLGPKPSFVGTGDYRQIWEDQAKADNRDGRDGLLSESGEDPDELRWMPYWRYLRSGHWQVRRRLALAVAEHQCFYCGATEHLDVHHLTYKRRGCELDEDLIVLCRPCHDIEHQPDGALAETYRRAATQGPTP